MDTSRCNTQRVGANQYTHTHTHTPQGILQAAVISLRLWQPDGRLILSCSSLFFRVSVYSFFLLSLWLALYLCLFINFCFSSSALFILFLYLYLSLLFPKWVPPPFSLLSILFPQVPLQLPRPVILFLVFICLPG